MPRRSSHVDPNQLIDELDPVGTQLSWPRPVSHRLDQLVDLARRARTNRSEVAAAIVASASFTEEDLVRLILAYRGKRARDVVLDVQDDASVIPLPRPGPGRRKGTT